ncbi:MAG: PadR family transcriptional regulator [Clostridia bacterium]|nr:PadR family transcriptional regulator [Clostridia bacterium]
MLPKVSVLILGIIKERPLNPYEINKLLEEINVKKWFPVAASSVYATVRNLDKNGYITGTVKKDSNMPEKTIFSVTEKGRKMLEQSLKEYLGCIELDNVKSNIACMFICHLHKEEAYGILKEKLEKFKHGSFRMKKQIEMFEDNKQIPSTAIIILKRNMNLINAEIKMIEELIEYMDNNEAWNHYLAIDLKRGKKEK